MMKVTIFMGSACHLKGSREIIEKLQKLVTANGLSDKVDLNGAFGTGNCDHGVCVTVDGELYSLQPEDTEAFFEKLPRKRRAPSSLLPKEANGFCAGKIQRKGRVER